MLIYFQNLISVTNKRKKGISSLALLTEKYIILTLVQSKLVANEMPLNANIFAQRRNGMLFNKET